VIHAREDYNRIQDPAGKIPIDEPVFLIRGQDTVGPEAVEAWAELAEKLGAGSDIILKAREHAEAMRTWQWCHSKKTPDLPQRPPFTIFDIPVSPVAMEAVVHVLVDLMAELTRKITQGIPQRRKK